MKKTFDCVEMKRRCQKEIRRRVEGMSREEEIAFFREVGQKLEKDIRLAKERDAQGHLR